MRRDNANCTSDYNEGTRIGTMNLRGPRQGPQKGPGLCFIIRRDARNNRPGARRMLLGLGVALPVRLLSIACLCAASWGCHEISSSDSGLGELAARSLEPFCRELAKSPFSASVTFTSVQDASSWPAHMRYPGPPRAGTAALPLPSPSQRPCRFRTASRGCSAHIRYPGPLRAGTAALPPPSPSQRPCRLRTSSRGCSAGQHAAAAAAMQVTYGSLLAKICTRT